MQAVAVPKGRILCTEDDPDSLEMLSILLTSSGYEVVCTGEAEDAIRLAKEQAFDIYVLDNWLPEVSGVEMTQRIREFDTSTPVVFYSGAAQNSDRREAFQAGAQAYLIKPLGVQTLIQEIESLIHKSKTAAA